LAKGNYQSCLKSDVFSSKLVKLTSDSFLRADYVVFLQPELIRFWGYVCEEHFVTTKDGYRIGIHRIPKGKVEPATTTNSSVKSVVLLGHGIISSSSAWTFGPPDKSLGYVLADAGKLLTLCFLVSILDLSR